MEHVLSVTLVVELSMDLLLTLETAIILILQYSRAGTALHHYGLLNAQGCNDVAAVPNET